MAKDKPAAPASEPLGKLVEKPKAPEPAPAPKSTESEQHAGQGGAYVMVDGVRKPAP
jgi:hypothetical protein